MIIKFSEIRKNIITNSLIKSEEEAIQVVAASLFYGDLCLIPTETVYGLVCLDRIPCSDREFATPMQKLFSLKGRDEGKPIAKLVSLELGSKMLDDTILNNNTQKKARELLKTGATIVFIHQVLGQIGIRVPQSTFCQNLLQVLHRPLFATSANVSSYAPPTRLKNANKTLINGCAIVIEDDMAIGGIPSTVVNFVTKTIDRYGLQEVDLSTFETLE